MAQVTEVCFVLGGEEFHVKGSKLRKSSKYFEDLFENSQEFTEIRLILPEWIKVRPFKVYLSYIENSRLPKLDLITAQKCLWLGDFFKDNFLQTTLIKNHILPFLNKETVLLFVQDTCTKICNSTEVDECWYELFTESCSFAAENLAYFLGETYSVFTKLDNLSIKQIFEQSSNFSTLQGLLPKLQQIKKCDSLLELITQLETESLLNFHTLHNNLLVYEWNIDDFEFGNFYKETEPFKIGSTDWVLCIWCFEHEKRLEFSLKLAEVTKSLKQKLSVITSSVLLQNENFTDIEPKILPIPAYSQDSPIIREISSGKLESVSSLRVKLYASSEEIISAILTEILNDPEILAEQMGNISSYFLLSILNSKYFNVKSEDFAVEVLAKWVEKNLDAKDEVLQTLNDSILWEYVSVRELISVAFNFQTFKKIPIFQISIKKELENKGKKLGSKKYLEDNQGGRKSYKEKAAREHFTNQKEYFGVIFDLILNVETRVKSI